MNPSRNRDSGYQPSRVTLAVLTHMPNEDGYFEHRFEVLRLCLESLIRNTESSCDLMVFDNASSPQVVDYLSNLRDENQIQYLILSSRNIGKIDALQMIFQSAPGEIVAYSDDDVFFLPGWLDEHLKILETFPKVGMVTGFYIRSQLNWSVQSTLAFAAQAEVTSTKGLLWERRWEEHYIENMGRTWEKYAEETNGLQDTLLTYKDVSALVSAGHHQFVAYRDVIRQALPATWTGRLMGKMRELDDAIDKAGYLRLNTPLPVTRLLGNVVSTENAELARSLGMEATAASVAKSAGWMQKIARTRWINGLARRIYNGLYKIINA
jgi:glycosyltransferase involved in cell wall biosynthesis